MKSKLSAWLRREMKEWAAFMKYNPFVPLSKRDKQGVLERYVEAKDRYLPLIEQRTGICLGDVQIISLREHVRKGVKKVLKKGLKETNKKFEKGVLLFSYIVAFPALELFRAYLDDLGGLASYNSSTQSISVPFGFGTKIGLYHESASGIKSQRIDETVLHELTHHLWNRIPGRTEPRGETPQLWSEGFAVYGADTWFADFLPTGKNKRNIGSYPKPYQRGRKTIERLVQKHGEEILLEIPRRWREFEKELS
jgi:hypothetical protein